MWNTTSIINERICCFGDFGSLSPVLNAAGGGWCINRHHCSADATTQQPVPSRKQQPVPSQKSNTCDLYEKTHPARDWCLKTSKLLDATSSVAFVFRLRPAASALYESSHIWPFSNISLVSLFSPFHPSDHKSPGAVSLTHNGRLSCAHHFSAMVFRKVAVASRPCAHFRRGTPSHPLPIFGQERSGVSTRRGILLST